MKRLHVALATAAGTYLAMLAARSLMPPYKIRRHRFAHLYDLSDGQFLRSMGSLLPPPYVPGNRITTLHNGQETFPAMLAAIGSARRTIAFEMFIYLYGRIGYRLADAIIERARAGVRAHILLDWVGSALIDPVLVHRMRQAGVDVLRFQGPPWWSLRSAIVRSHRKILVVDGRIGFTGGINVADAWTGNARDFGHWRDMHYRIEGPAVAQLQHAFMNNWLKTHERVLDGPGYFPPLPPAGDCLAQVFPGSPDEDGHSIRLLYSMAIYAATRSIRLATPYFVPDRLMVRALVDACRRGVKVEVLCPSRHIDLNFVRRASRALWGPLLDAGVNFYEYQPAMYHCKALIIDDLWSSVGSTNFDNRSFRLNDEVNLNVYDAGFAAEQVEWFERDKARSRHITRLRWRHRGPFSRLLDGAFSLLRSQF